MSPYFARFFATLTWAAALEGSVGPSSDQSLVDPLLTSSDEGLIIRRQFGHVETADLPMKFCHGEVQSNMTPQQVDLVKQSFAKVVPIRDDAAALFYQRLFEIAPDVKTLFPNDMVEQGRKLMTMLGTVVNGLHDLDAIVPAAQQLAVRHVDYGVRPEHYAPVGEALIWTLEQGLQDAFDAPTKEAWLTAYTILSTTMIDAAYA